MRHLPGISPLRGLVDTIARALESEPARVAARLWPEVAGEQVASRTWVSRVRGDTMFIVASSSVWAHQLQLMERELVSRLRDRAGDGCPVTRLWFSAGGKPEPEDTGFDLTAPGTAPGPAPGERRPTPVTREIAAAAREAACRVDDPDLAKAVERALKVQDPKGR